MKFLENRIPPPIVVFVIGAAMWLVARFTQHVTWAGVLRFGLVICLVGLGVSLSESGFRAFARAKTTIDPVNLESASTLVIGGVFRLSRNPMYVGFAALLTAWAMWLQAPWALTGVLVFVVFIRRFQIIPEERVLTAKFGSSYDQYRDRVRRWL